jgi:hypothetical protein
MKELPQRNRRGTSGFSKKRASSDEDPDVRQAALLELALGSLSPTLLFPPFLNPVG